MAVVNINDVLDGHVALDVDCLDRVYLNAYVPNLQVGGQVVTFLTQHLGNEVPSPALVVACSRLRPDPARLAEPAQATKAALQALAQRIQALEAELAIADQRLGQLVSKAAPRTMALFAIGVDHAGQLLTTAGQHPERLRGEAAFAHLCGAAPIPASSGKTRRHRLHRGGDRAANRALHLAAVVRLRWCAQTRAYAARRTAEGLSTREIIRCVKRYLAREVYHALKADFEALHAT